MVEIPIELPLDIDGFLRRECPNCEQEFKWHHGPTDDAPEDFIYPPVYCCPRCGRSAENDSWWTPAQLTYAEESLAGPALGVIADELASGFRGITGIEFRPANNTDQPAPPDPMVEPDDMMLIIAPCHPWEPVKVPDVSVAPYYCLLCGDAYAV